MFDLLTTTMINNDFWLARWSEGKIGFHRSDVNPLLIEFSDRIFETKPEHAYLPLCGKSKDLLFFAEQVKQVSGSEISPLAIQGFFEENQIEFTQTDSIYRSERIQLYQDDFFELNPSQDLSVDLIYDRAAMVAMPHERHRDYAKHLLQILKPGGRIFLIAFDYDPSEMSGPPFALSDEAVKSSFEGHELELLVQRDILQQEEKFKARGLSRLSESAWLISKTI